MSNTILLKGEVLGKEAPAGGTIVPGELIALNSAGAVIRQATAKAAAAAAFARELEFAGGGISDAYASGDTVPYYIAQKGAEIYGFLANGTNVETGDLLEAAGGGAFQKFTDGVPLAVALEDGVTTGSAIRLKLEVL